MGMFDTYNNKDKTFSVQLKTGPCTLREYVEGDVSPMSDGIYHDHHGVVVVREGFITHVGETAVGGEGLIHCTKTGGLYPDLDINEEPPQATTNPAEEVFILIYGSSRDGDTFALGRATRDKFPGCPSRVFVGKDHRRKDDYSIFNDPTAIQAVTCILTLKTKIYGYVVIVDPVTEDVKCSHVFCEPQPQHHEGRHRLPDGTYVQD